MVVECADPGGKGQSNFGAPESENWTGYLIFLDFREALHKFGGHQTRNCHLGFRLLFALNPPFET